jgi:hypothetical protein
MHPYEEEHSWTSEWVQYHSDVIKKSILVSVAAVAASKAADADCRL